MNGPPPVPPKTKRVLAKVAMITSTGGFHDIFLVQNHIEKKTFNPETLAGFTICKLDDSLLKVFS